MKKIIPIFLGSCISVISYANTNSISVSPANGEQQSKQDIYGNGFEQLPFIVTIHYDTYVGDDRNNEYFDNLQFQVGSIFTSEKAKDLEMNKSCAYDDATGAPFQNMSYNTGAGDDGQVLFYSHDIRDSRLALHKNNEGLRWKHLEHDPYHDHNVSLCFTERPNIFSTGVYPKDRDHYQSMQPKQHKSHLKSGKQCDYEGQRDCEVSRTYYMQVDARDYHDNFKVMTLNVKTSLNNNLDPLKSVFEYENFQVLEYVGNNHELDIKDEKDTDPAEYGHKFTVTVDGEKATILFVGIYKDAADIPEGGSWDIKDGSVHLPWLTTAHDDKGALRDNNALINCGPGMSHICIHNSNLESVNDTRFHSSAARWKAHQWAYMDNAYHSTINEAKERANWAYATVAWNTYDLVNGRPNGGQFAYLGTDHDNYRPSNYEFNFYIVDKYGNFTNKSKTPIKHV